ncbi:MAG: hypothetical protein ABSA45_10755 [Verrucomicrobiota bacterium]|jgi:transcriptional regulator with XRE-family HTH domain
MSASLKSCEADMVRIKLIRRGWSLADIARRCGLSERSFATQLSGSFPNIAARAKVEMAFDYSVALWDSAGALAARKLCRDRFGADPALLSLSALRQLAAQIALPGWKDHALKKDLLPAVITHLTAIKTRDATTAKHKTTIR